jgi:hypothetical protein
MGDVVGANGNVGSVIVAVVVLVVVWPHFDAADPVSFGTGCERWCIVEIVVYSTSATPTRTVLFVELVQIVRLNTKRIERSKERDRHSKRNRQRETRKSNDTHAVLIPRPRVIAAIVPVAPTAAVAIFRFSALCFFVSSKSSSLIAKVSASCFAFLSCSLRAPSEVSGNQYLNAPRATTHCSFSLRGCGRGLLLWLDGLDDLAGLRPLLCVLTLGVLGELGRDPLEWPGRDPFE